MKDFNMSKHIEDYTEEELKLELLTSDYKGKEFKKKCLDELLSREYVRGLEDGRFQQSFYSQ
jgi:hypothetical protein